MTDQNDDQPQVSDDGRLATDIAAMPLEALHATAVDLGIALLPDETREEMDRRVVETILARRRAAVEGQAEREREAQAKVAREEFFRSKEGRKVKRQHDDFRRNQAVRNVHRDLIRALPNEARLQGSIEIAADDIRAGDHPVPDGSYRVLGSEWVLDFRAGRWAGARKAHARAAPDWIEVPDNELAPAQPAIG